MAPTSSRSWVLRTKASGPGGLDVGVPVDPHRRLDVGALPVVGLEEQVPVVLGQLVAVDDDGPPRLQVAGAGRPPGVLEDALDRLPGNRLPRLEPADAPAGADQAGEFHRVPPPASRTGPRRLAPCSWTGGGAFNGGSPSGGRPSVGASHHDSRLVSSLWRRRRGRRVVAAGRVRSGCGPVATPRAPSGTGRSRRWGLRSRAGLRCRRRWRGR